MPSEVAGCRVPANGDTPVLFVNGFDRFDRSLDIRQTAGPGIGGPNGGLQTFDRVIPRLMNSFDYVVQHGEAISRNGVAFDSCQNEAVSSGLVPLANYQAAIWAAGQESTADETFSAVEQVRLAQYLGAGGNLFVSGAEIAWDLDRDNGPTVADRAFLNLHLHADLAGDINDDAGTYSFAPASGSIFAGNAAGRFDDGSAGTYNVGFADILSPAGTSARLALVYTGGRPGAAAVQNVDAISGARVVCFGFPFETIIGPSAREAAMFDILAFFGVIPAPLLEPPRTELAEGTVTLRWSSIPGKRYRVQVRTTLDAAPWFNLSGDVIATGPTASKVDTTPSAVPQRFYRVLVVD
jgi:hypothetical protein